MFLHCHETKYIKNAMQHSDFEHFQYWKDTTLTLENTFPYSFHCSNSSENQNLNTISL